MTPLEARLKAQRAWIARVLATKPLTEIGKMRRKALEKRLQNFFDVRGHWAAAYKDHFAALHDILGSKTVSEAGASSPSAEPKGGLEDF
jgi:hypothetical protein